MLTSNRLWFMTQHPRKHDHKVTKHHNQHHKKPVPYLRVTNVLLSVFALLLAFLVEGVHTLYPLTTGLSQLIGLVSLTCIVIAVLLTHTLLGKTHSNSWQVWQPFIGGWRFVTVQSISWTLLAIALLITGLSLHPSHLHRGTYAIASSLGFLSEVLMICSIPLFESPSQPSEKSTSIQLRWNDVGTINIIVAALSLLFAAFLDHLRDLSVYTAQLHNFIGVVSVLCLIIAVVLTHTFVGRMRHGSVWRNWNPLFAGGWRFAALQVASWTTLFAAVCMGAYSLYYTAMEGTMTATGALGFISVLLMVVSIQMYAVPVATESVKKLAPSQFTPFQQFILTLATLGEDVRRFLVIAFIFNVFYAPLGVVLPAIIPFFIVPIPEWIIATALCLVFATYATASYLPRPEVTGSRDSGVRESFMVKDVIKYFNGKVVKTAELESDEQYIYGFHPHGILPMASMWAHNSDSWKTLFKTPKRKAVTLVASHLFKIPFTRDFLAASGAREVSKIAFETALNQKKSVFLVPGGMREMQYSFSHEKDITICTKHKGFIRMAMKHGVDLVPVYSFGETKLLDGAFPKLQKWCWKYISMPFPLFYGRWGLPIPRPQQVTVVVGPAIHVTQNSNPTQEEIDAIGKVYFDSLQDIFEKNKVACGHAESRLIFD